MNHINSMSKVVLFLGFYLLLLCCGCKGYCPDAGYIPQNVQAMHLEKQYSLACFSMYALNSCCDGQCLAQQTDKDTAEVNLLALDLKLTALQARGDTTVFFFDFYRVNGRDTVIVHPYSEDYTRCRYNGIAVSGSGAYGIPTTLGAYTLRALDTLFVEEAHARLRRQCQLQSDGPAISQTLRCVLAAQR